MQIILTVADHEQNGFVELAAWKHLSDEEARELIAKVDGLVSDEMEPDETSSFAFILDLKSDDGWDLTDTGTRTLPTQVAMRLAPDAVQDWLDERPVPDTVFHRPSPVLDISVLRRL